MTNSELERRTEHGKHMNAEAVVAYARAEVARIRANTNSTRTADKS